ncbi:MAG TPA: alpha/beta fold hydrolase [Candidatus Peribacteraceae bacterium]|nr:alpha/beta fold hydrolase [Candidatus Peribacteraceae bacterium]
MPRALVIPGIQDTPEDWDDLQHQLGNDLILIHSKRPSFDKRFRSNPDEWLQTLDTHYLQQAQEHDCDILIAHSFGSRIAIDTLLQTSNLKGGILVAPGKNGVNVPPAEDGRSLTEMMMKPITYAMGPDVYERFLSRHESQGEQSEAKNRMRTELGLIKNGPPLSHFLDQLNGTSLLVIRAPQDPWDIKELDDLHSESIAISTIQDADHYPHVSRTQEVTYHVRAWMKDVGLLIDASIIASTHTTDAQAITQA